MHRTRNIGRLVLALIGGVGMLMSARPATAQDLGLAELLKVLEQARQGGLLLQQALEMADAATREVNTTFLSELRRWNRGSELTVAKVEQVLTVAYSDTNWRGTITVQTAVTCQLHYAVRLGGLSPNDLRYDPATRVLRVRMPNVELSAVEPDLAKARHRILACDGLRFEFYDAGDARAAALARITDGARQKGNSDVLLSAARSAAREELTRLFGQILRAARVEADVIVE